MSLFDTIYRIEKGLCTDCRIEKRDRANHVFTCERHRKEYAEWVASLEAMTLEEFISEVVNGRAEVGDARSHYYALYEKYMSEMPYGTAKARDGDPCEWITERLFLDFEHLIEVEAEL